MINIVNGTFEADVALTQGINKITLLSFNCKGGVFKRPYQVLFSAPLGGVPIVKLESPQNGRQGIKEGDPIMVEGVIDDPSIDIVTLLMNKIPIQVKVQNGRFSRKVFMPAGRVATFRVMAKSKSGAVGYSALHTILVGYEIDILNPRPF